MNIENSCLMLASEMKAVRTFETPVRVYQSKLLNIADDLNVQDLRSDSLQCRLETWS
jgi:hypothetical protein